MSTSVLASELVVLVKIGLCDWQPLSGELPCTKTGLLFSGVKHLKDTDGIANNIEPRSDCS